MAIELRERTRENVVTYFEKTKDAEIEKMLPRSVETVEQATANYERSILPDADSFGQTIWMDGRYIGNIWCYCINREEHPNAMLSYCIFDKDYWGKGIASQATAKFLEVIREKFSLSSIGAFTYADNRASIRVLEKNGFVIQESFIEDNRESCYLEYNF